MLDVLSRFLSLYLISQKSNTKPYHALILSSATFNLSNLFGYYNR